MGSKYLLAPMAALSHRALRELIESLKPRNCPGGVPDEYFSEMISAGAMMAGGPFEDWYTDNGPCPDKLVYQLVGGDADILIRGAAFLDKKECLGIDVNMGCSAPAIIRSGAGVRWMADIDRVAALAVGLRKAVKRRLSVKLRIGLNDDFDYLARFCLALENEGVDFITLHPRTSKEKFKRRSRWDYVRRLRKILKIPLGGNGDIHSAKEMLARAADCDAVMVGRAALRQPWIFAQARALEAGANYPPPSIEDTGLRFLELLEKHQPPEFFLSRARLFFSYFCDNLKWGTHLNNTLNREESLSGISRVWKAFFREHGEEGDVRSDISWQSQKGEM